MFESKVVSALVRLARRNSIEPAALLAITEVESSGRPFEPDGKTPRFLFERHVFYRVLKNGGDSVKLKQAISEGLAIPKWDQKTQYRDLKTPHGRANVLARARAIDEECANRACSWGLGQILGENARSLGYPSASVMVATFVNGGIAGQTEGMLRYIRKHRLTPYLNLHDWAAFALAYNGAGYKQNRYDVKMAAAYEKWAAQIDRTAIEPSDPAPPDATVPPEVEPEAPDVEDMPPPYEPPKTVAKSKTIWSSAIQVLSGAGAMIGTWLSDWRVIAVFVVVIVFLAIFIGRERILKIIEDNR